MDNEILVKEFRKIIKILKAEDTHIALFMLKAADIEVMGWNLIVSTVRYDSLTAKKALKELVGILNKNMKKNILKEISRMTVLKTNDPLVEEINRTFRIKNSIKYINASYFFGIYIENAILFESAPVPFRMRNSKHNEGLKFSNPAYMRDKNKTDRLSSQ